MSKIKIFYANPDRLASTEVLQEAGPTEMNICFCCDYERIDDDSIELVHKSRFDQQKSELDLVTKERDELLLALDRATDIVNIPERNLTNSDNEIIKWLGQLYGKYKAQIKALEKGQNYTRSGIKTE